MSDSYLENFLSNIHPFLEGDNLGEFISELKKVPNYRNVFQALIKEDPAWLEEVRESSNKVYFFLETVKLPKNSTSRCNELCLRHFQLGKSPTIKVTKYCCSVN